MADIWSGIGAELSQDEGEWLYRVGKDVRGPLEQRLIVDKLIQGEIDLSTLVARVGTEFSPIGQVRAFEQHIRAAKKARAQRVAQKRRKLILIISMPVLLIAVGVGLFLHHDYQKHVKADREHAAELARVAKEQLAAQRAAIPKTEDLPKMGLVALVSLGTQDDVKIHGDTAQAPATKTLHRPNAKHKARESEGPEGPAEAEQSAAPEEEFQTCKLSQQDIFGTLRSHLATLNVCVEDEKKRDTQGLLPPKLELSFVVKPSGKVGDFAIDDRHYRTGPLNNCMIKAFNSMAFPTSTGANCPITIPIKISK